MPDAIAVVNAGSSSIKFSLFALADSALELKARGQFEGIYTAPRIAANDGVGASLVERPWTEGVKLGHEGALDHLIQTHH
jgi:acetate kinase